MRGKRSTSPRVCEDCGAEVIGKYRRRRCENCYRTVLRREKGIQPATRARAPLGQPALRARLLDKTTPGYGGCVIYTGRTNGDGYGLVPPGTGRDIRAHRLAYELFVGSIPEGLALDHLCHNRDDSCPGGKSCLHRRCVNPHHLEPVTSAENTRRADNRICGPRKRGHEKFCRRGHEMTPENSLWEKRAAGSDSIRRRCKQCTTTRRQAREKRAA